MTYQLSKKTKTIEQDVREEKKKLKFKASFDAGFWNRPSNTLFLVWKSSTSLSSLDSS